MSLALRMMSYWVSEEYSMKFDRVASSNLMNSLIQSADGAYTVPGGFPTIKSLLIKLITATGGQVLTDVPVSEIVLNDKNNEVLGVYVQDPNSQTKPIRVMCRRGLISGTGVLHTLTNFIPLSVTSMPLTSARNKLKKVEEKRPKMFVIFWISGDVLSSELSPCEYIQYLADETNQSERSKGLRSIKIWSPSARDSTRSDTVLLSLTS